MGDRGILRKVRPQVTLQVLAEFEQHLSANAKFRATQFIRINVLNNFCIVRQMFVIVFDRPVLIGYLNSRSNYRFILQKYQCYLRNSIANNLFNGWNSIMFRHFQQNES